MKFVQKSPLIITVLLFIGSIAVASCTLEVDVVSRCTSLAKPNYESSLKMTREAFPGWDESDQESFAQRMFDDPDAPRVDFAKCLIDEGALCYLKFDEVPIDYKPLLVERGWANPTVWDCYWPKSKMVTTNPFK